MTFEYIKNGVDSYLEDKERGGVTFKSGGGGAGFKEFVFEFDGQEYAVTVVHALENAFGDLNKTLWILGNLSDGVVVLEEILRISLIPNLFKVRC
ncbi:MAG: hypothetical protein KAJ86_07890 [Alphaproteobacteria bacterium]|nr:hypothetical protein [Alphaproteobacteria bacterium]